MILVKTAGIQATIQDGGRYGYQHIGISPSGVMDKNAYEIANYLVANEPHAACIETVYGGLVLEFYEPMAIAITGADFKPKINGCLVSMYETLYVIPGDVLEFGNPDRGIYGYIAFSSGLCIKPFLGSCSTDLKSGIGGIDGRQLHNGQRLSLKGKAGLLCKKRMAPKFLWTDLECGQAIRIIEGPEISHFTDQSIDTLLNETFQVNATSNRMGYRLNGHGIRAEVGHDIISCGLTKGTIQATESGELIVMMADHQSTGGYLRIANVVSVDLPVLAQMRPGQTVKFKQISLEEAQAQISYRHNQLIYWLSAYDHDGVNLNLNSKYYSINFNQKKYSVLVSDR